MLQACFFSSTLSPVAQPPVDLSVERMSWAALGGPKKASLRASGVEVALWNLAGLLRKPVEIRDRGGRPVWWGYVETVEIASGRIAARLSLDGMANRIAVVYAHLPAGAAQAGARKTSAWADDLVSQATYGVKEMLLTLDSASDEQALQRRDAELTLRATPLPGLTILPEPVDPPYARITCRGWWEMYGWQRFTRPAGYLGNDVLSTGIQPLGSLATNSQIAQGFTPGPNSWWAEQAWVRVRKVGSPADSLTLDLASDSSGAPGTELASITIPAAEISAEDYLWVGGALNARVNLAPGASYWLRVRRSGGADANNFYQIDVDENLSFDAGEMKVFSGSAWAARSPAANLVFRVLGVEETTDQVVAAALGTRTDDFVIRAEKISGSGVYSCPYRDGDTTRLEVIRELLESGTNTGQELLGTVGHDRVFTIQTRLAPGEADWTVDRSGRLYDEFGNVLPGYASPAGRWVCFRDLPSAGIFAKGLNQPLRSFVSSAEYDALTGKMHFATED